MTSLIFRMLLNDILDLSKIESDHLTLERIPLKLGELIGTVETLASERIQAKGLTFVHPFDDPAVIDAVRAKVSALCARFPVYGR